MTFYIELLVFFFSSGIFISVFFFVLTVTCQLGKPEIITCTSINYLALQHFYNDFLYQMENSHEWSVSGMQLAVSKKYLSNSSLNHNDVYYLFIKVLR